MTLDFFNYQNIRRVVVGAFAVLGLVSMVGVIFAVVLPDMDVPSDANYKRCLDRAAEKAQGAVSIFNTLHRVQCLDLKPSSDAPVGKGLFDDIPYASSARERVMRDSAGLSADKFLDDVTDER